jgi:putative hemolysin
MCVMPVYAQVLIIFVLLLCNGCLAMAEMSIVSSRKARLHKWADDGDRGAKLALDIADSPNEFLSTIQIGITLVGIFTGAFGGATIADRLALHFNQIPALEPYADAIAFSIVVVSITYLSLIIGELVPKRLALHSPEKIARVVAGPMRILSQIAKPLVSLLSASTALVVRLIGVHEQSEPHMTEAEIQVLVEQATDEGVFEEAEQEMIASVLELGDKKVTSLMTPRTHIAWIDVSADEEQVLKVVQTSTHTRFPVAEGSLDRLIGVVETKDIMRRKLLNEPLDLRSIVFQPIFVPETRTALQLLERFRSTQQRVAVVLDEYGGLHGLVTTDDIFQAIVGDLPTQGEPKWQAHKRADGSWLLDGQMPIADFEEMFDLEDLPGEDAEYHTLAGFVLSQLKHVPEPGESFEWNELRFEVMDMDRHRIDKVVVSRVPANEA